MHNFRRNTCRTWSNSIQEKIQKSKSPSAPSHCLFLTNTNNHPACFLLCRRNILFALIALLKWLARQLWRDRSRDEECESSIPCWVHRVRLNGDELALVTSHKCMRTPVHAHGHKQSVLPHQESKEANHCFFFSSSNSCVFESGFVSVMTTFNLLIWAKEQPCLHGDRGLLGALEMLGVWRDEMIDWWND